MRIGNFRFSGKDHGSYGVVEMTTGPSPVTVGLVILGLILSFVLGYLVG
jgi:hypothetical protein